MRIMIHLSLQTVNKLLTPEGRRRTSPRPPPPPPQVGRETYSPQSSSAHADGGAAGVKKRLSLAARHRFFGQAPKKWGRMAGQAIDYHPTYRHTRRRHNDESALSCAVTCAPSPWVEVSPPCCPVHPSSLLLRKETGWSPKETRLWVPPRELFGPARLSHGREAPTSQPTASS